MTARPASSSGRASRRSNGYDRAQLRRAAFLLVFLVAALVMAVVLHRSIYGRYLFASAGRGGGALFGIRTHRVIAVAYIICGGLAGLSSIYSLCTRARSLPARTQFSTSSTASPRPCSEAARCARRRLDPRHRARHDPAAGAAEPGELLGIRGSLNFAVMGTVILIGVLADQQLLRWAPPAARPRAEEPVPKIAA